MAVSKLRAILETGVQNRASDWHIRENSPVYLRVDSGLVEISDFTPDREYLLECLQGMCEPKTLKHFEETGDADFAHQEDGVGRFRVNLHRQRGLMAMCLRHVKDKVPNFKSLGLPQVVATIAEAERGIVLVTGTTGSGKSTTLACMLEHLNATTAMHIITIEDPIEYNFKDNMCIFEQREVGLDAITFQSALTHALRQDPDIVVVGEMRSRESFDTAMHAADTGHLVMTTLHTTNAALTLQRILDFYPHEERDQIRKSLAGNLHAIISQRLCPRAFGKGVVPAMEVMVNTATVRKLIHDGKLEKLSAAIEGGGGDGMMSFNQCLLKLVNDGLVTEEVALEYATNPDALKMNLKGIFVSGEGGIIN
jgi:twitching motility protein PilT